MCLQIIIVLAALNLRAHVALLPVLQTLAQALVQAVHGEIIPAAVTNTVMALATVQAALAVIQVTIQIMLKVIAVVAA